VDFVAALGKIRSWDAFSAWCDERGLAAAPANPWTLAAYIRFVEGTMRYDVLRRHVDQIGQMHFEKRRTRPDRTAMVQRTLDSVRRRAEARKRQSKEKTKPVAPLFEAEDFLDAKTPQKNPKMPRKRQPRDTAPAKHRALRVTPKLVRRKRV